MLGARFARPAFEQAGDALARELAAELAAQLPREDAAGWLAALVEELAQLGHLLRVEDDSLDRMQIWGDFAFISCDVFGHDLALFVHGRFAAGAAVQIDGIEVLWRKT